MPRKKRKHHKRHFHLTAIIIFIAVILVSALAFYIFVSERKNNPKTPGFDDYRVSEAPSGKPEVNFAGHFILNLQSCGQNCQTGSVKDALSGKVYDLPIKPACGLDFRKDSKLLILNSASGCPGNPRYFIFGE